MIILFGAGMFANKKKGKLVGPSDFEVVSLVGKGAFGKVYLVRNIHTSKQYAMKVMSKNCIVGHDYIEHTNKEREIMSDISGLPFLTDLSFSFQTENSVYLVMNFVGGGSLFDYVSSLTKPMGEKEAAFYIAQIIIALESLHDRNIIYRDLKLENILIDEDGYIQLSDFGLSAVLRKGDVCTSFSGTRDYLSPELLEGEHDRRADFWAVGVLTFFLLTLEPPFYSENIKDLFEMIKNEEVDYGRHAHLSEMALSFMKSLMTKDPHERLGSHGIKEIKAHGFFSSIEWKKMASKKIKAPYLPTLTTGEKVSVSYTTDIEEKDTQEEQESRIDVFGGFTFVASHSQTSRDLFSFSDHEEGRKGKAQIIIDFVIEVQRADGFKEKYNSSQFYVKWVCDSKKVSNGLSYASVCSEREVQWNSSNGETTGRFTTTMYLDHANSFDSRDLTLSIRDKKTDKSIGSIKLDMGEYAYHNYKQQQIFSLSHSLTLTCQLSSTWKYYNGSLLQLCDSEEECKTPDVKMIEVNGEKYRLLDIAKLDTTTSSKKLKRSESKKKVKKEGIVGAAEEGIEENEKKKKKKLTKLISGSFKGSSKKRRASALSHSITEEESETEGDFSEEESQTEDGASVPSISHSQQNKNTKIHDNVPVGQFKKRKGVNTMKVRFDIVFQSLSQLPSKCIGKQVQLTWKRGAKEYNSGKSEKLMCSGHSLEVQKSATIQCNLYQQKIHPFAFEEQMILFGMKYESSSGKILSLAKGAFDLASISALDGKKSDVIVDLKNSKGLTIKVAFSCVSSWITINDAPIAGAKPMDTSSDKKRLSRVLSFKNWKKSATERPGEEDTQESDLDPEISQEETSLRAENEIMLNQIAMLKESIHFNEVEKSNTDNEVKKQLEEKTKEVVVLQEEIQSLRDTLKAVEGDTCSKMILEHEESAKHDEMVQELKKEALFYREQVVEVQKEAVDAKNEVETLTSAMRTLEKSIKKHKSKGKEWSKQMEEMNASLVSKTTQLEMREKNDSSLVVATQTLLQDKALDNQSLRKQIETLQSEREALEVKNKKSTKKISSAQKQIATLTTDIEMERMQALKASEDKREAQEEIKNLSSRIAMLDAEKDRSIGTDDESRVLERKRMKEAEEKVKNGQETIENLEKTLNEYKIQYNAIKEENERLMECKNESTKKIEKTENTLALLTASHDQLKVLHSKESEENKKSKEREEEYNQTINEMKEKVKTLEMEVNAARDLPKDSSDENPPNHNEEIASEMQKELEEKDKKIEKLENEISTVKDTLVRVQSLVIEKDKYIEEIDTLDTSIEDTKIELEEKKEEVAKKNGLIEQLRHHASINDDEIRTLQMKLDQKESRGLPDIGSSQEEEFSVGKIARVDFLSFLLDHLCTAPLDITEYNEPIIGKRVIEFVSSLNEISEVASFLDEFNAAFHRIFLSCSKHKHHDIFSQLYWIQTSYFVLQRLQESERLSMRQYTFEELFYDELEGEDSSQSETGVEEQQSELEKEIMNIVDLFLCSISKKLESFINGAFFPGEENSLEQKERAVLVFLHELRKVILVMEEVKLLDDIVERLVQGMFEFINAFAFNQLMKDAGRCSVEVGLNIKFALSMITNWWMTDDVLQELTSKGCGSAKNSAALLLRMTPLLQASNALVILPNGSVEEFSSYDELKGAFSRLTGAQLAQLCQHFTSSERYPQHIPERLCSLIAENVEEEENGEDLTLDYPFITDSPENDERL